MANTEDTTPLPDSVAQDATETVEMNTREIVLLGVFGTDEAPQALVRLPDGAVEKVERGSKVKDRKVVAIGKDRIALSRGGSAEWLEMPAG